VSNFHRASPRFSGYCRLLRLIFGRFPGKRPLCNAQKVQSAAKAPFLQLQDQQFSAKTLNFTGTRPFFRQNTTFASREWGRVGQKRAVANDIDGAFRRASAKTCSFAGFFQKSTESAAPNTDNRRRSAIWHRATRPARSGITS
jgi:hypothetical protein